MYYKTLLYLISKELFKAMLGLFLDGIQEYKIVSLLLILYRKGEGLTEKTWITWKPLT